MRSVEVTSKSREDAIEQALKQLGVERDEIETEILQHGSKGFLGIGARQWQLRVSTEAAAPATQKPKREGGRGRGRRGGSGQKREGSDAKPRNSKSNDSRPNKRERKPRSGGQRTDGDAKRSDRPERKPRSERSERKPRPERKPRSERPSETPGSAEVAVAAAAGPRKSTEASDTEAAALLQEMIQLMGIECEVSHLEDEDKNLRLAVSSEDSALLIGRKGRGLASLQYVINRVARGIEGRDETERIIVDVEGYLDRRKQSLEEMALRMAERVKETGRRFSMRPMNPQERRVVHVALQEDEELRTFSVGDSAIRRVVIAPKDEEREERPSRRPRRERNDRNDRPSRNRDRDDSSRGSNNGNGNVDDLDAQIEDKIDDLDTNAIELDSAANDARDEAPITEPDTVAEENVETVADDGAADQPIVEDAVEAEEVTEAVAEEQSGNGESSSDEEPAAPRRRRRTSTYKRGRR